MILYFTVEGNEQPNLTVTLERNGTAIDLTSCSVDLRIAREDTPDTILNSGHTSCTIVTAGSGVIRYVPQAGDFPAEGRYTAQAKITYSTGKIERLPENITIVAEDAI